MDLVLYAAILAAGIVAGILIGRINMVGLDHLESVIDQYEDDLKSVYDAMDAKIKELTDKLSRKKKPV